MERNKDLVLFERNQLLEQGNPSKLSSDTHREEKKPRPRPDGGGR
uniref:Uncharacterized protein n=1 Tax=Arundo donax TaxID=35708 RepID=A0A0A9G8V9_ARUDO